jgi:hypothetical protein
LKKLFVSFLIICAVFALASAQKSKSWKDWSEKDAKKVLDNSGWAQTQTDTDTTQMFYTPTTSSTQTSVEGTTNQATSTNYHIRFLSSKPVRQAMVRLAELESHATATQLRAFAERNFDEWIVVAVTFDSKDGRYSGTSLQAFNSANIGVLKNKTYLERKDGKRLFLEDYKPPINDGLGAKFIFHRMEDGKPFITADTGEVRFVCEMPSASRTDTDVVQTAGSKFDPKNNTLALTNFIKLNMKFKINDMMYEGKLEY